MSAENHPAYAEELDRCRYTLEYVERSLQATAKNKERLDRDIERTKKHYNSDSSQDYIDLMINTMLQDNADLKIRNLKAARGKPYFARVDFNENGRKASERLYIGKMCLMRDEDQEIIIVDWRAPVANLYYEERLGNAAYKCPDGVIEGTLTLKRQFTINEGRLEDIFDIDVTASDELLQSCLGANADDRLKDIVSTIQAEQNKIIRADMWVPLIVQGAAGSGKTTIALHRIAYLAYTYEKTFNPESFMIIAPNRLFLNYISEVLPELGVERVRQTTFEEFAQDIIGKKFKLKDAAEKLAMFVDHNMTEEQSERNRLIRKCSEFKSSMFFKDVLDGYLSAIEREFIPREDFVFASTVIYKFEEINNLFLNEYKNWPIILRLNEIKKHLMNRIKLKKDAIINKLHDDCDTKVKYLKMTMEESDERQQLIIHEIDRKNNLISRIESHSKKAVNEYVAKISKVSPLQYYKDIITSRELLLRMSEDRADPDLLGFVACYSSEVFKSGYLEIEDLAPVIYLKFKIYGMDEKIPVKHIVIDEAQDFSVFQIYVLKKIIKDSSFTILGDLCQGIHSHKGVKDWEDLKSFVFSEGKNEFLTLEQSYRTTVEIMEAANKVISKVKDSRLVKAKPVIRHGEAVSVYGMNSLKEIAVDMEKRLVKLKAGGFKSAAIICKTLKECKTVQSFLKDNNDCPCVITGKEDQYKGGIVIMPSYLAKGLEFDAVIIANANSEEYRENELDIKLLYVAMTRPLHKLHIYYHGKISPLLADVRVWSFT